MSRKLYIIDSIRTNSFSDKNSYTKISNLWKKTMYTIPSNTVIYAIYSDYEDDFMGDYTFSLATKDHITEDIIYIPKIIYEKFPVDTKKYKDTSKTWKEIWDLERSDKIIRDYSLDFELYKPNGDISIYIGIKTI